jgi:hypothetical protein
MKVLILILLAAVYAAAQAPTVADVARKARARRAQSRNTKVYTTDDIRTTVPPSAEVDPAAVPAEGTLAEGAPVATPEVPVPAPTAVAAAETPVSDSAPVEDPVQQWLGENEKMREQLRDLMDQENVTQLEINALTNQINAPVTSQTAKDQAASGLQLAQERLKVTRERITKLRQELQARESQGPPKK